MSVNLNDYSHSDVPQEKRVPAIQIAMAIAAIGLTIPSFDGVLVSAISVYILNKYFK